MEKWRLLRRYTEPLCWFYVWHCCLPFIAAGLFDILYYAGRSKRDGGVISLTKTCVTKDDLLRSDDVRRDAGLHSRPVTSMALWAARLRLRYRLQGSQLLACPALRLSLWWEIHHPPSHNFVNPTPNRSPGLCCADFAQLPGLPDDSHLNTEHWNWKGIVKGGTSSSRTKHAHSANSGKGR